MTPSENKGRIRLFLELLSNPAAMEEGTAGGFVGSEHLRRLPGMPLGPGARVLVFDSKKSLVLACGDAPEEPSPGELEALIAEDLWGEVLGKRSAEGPLAGPGGGRF